MTSIMATPPHPAPLRRATVVNSDMQSQESGTADLGSAAPCSGTGEAEAEGPSNLLRLESHADITVARRLLASARERAAAGGDVVLDCSALVRLDGAGAQLLIALKRKLESQGRRLLLQSVPERVFGSMLSNGVGAALVAAEAR